MRVGLLMMGLSLALLWAWLGRYPALHADALTLSEVWRGIQEGAGVGRWLFSTACSLFPDLGATALASLWTQDLVAWQRWHGFFIGMGAAWGAARLMRSLWDLSAWQARSFAAMGLALGLLLCQPSGFRDLFSPGHHGWACVMALWAWAWALRQEEGPSRWSYSLWLALIWGLTWASDSFFLLWGLLPVLILALGSSKWARDRMTATVLASWPLKWLALRWLRSTGAMVGVFRWSYAWQHAGERWPAFEQGMTPLLTEQRWILLAAALSLGLWLWHARLEKRARLPLLAWAFSLGASLLLCLLAGLGPRYLLFPVWCLILTLPALVALNWPALSAGVLMVPALGAVLWLAPTQAPGADAMELRQAAWIDRLSIQYGLTQGWSDYFHSRPLRLLSQRHLQVLPMISAAPDHLDPYLWVVDRGIFPATATICRDQWPGSSDRIEALRPSEGTSTRRRTGGLDL